ncbi:FAD-linked oxidoreductase ZEB1 like protein [Verticillium longisporum]|uniref:FAD-linked oxidoreductase ZEB1 like protein n=1 Tax=Verticillium longisporum TaxID=100787 RepID=A0A0G4NC57_VERLO|nr:FAD-linked oxidoreductase ZEB1 like protein [Verticillium longisporum]KAG7139062.1 FAD-linked oxidoreductase ZEB1 like protein [Verticillium longisporum]CRK28782.1 hypothetical protein BN1708_004764 [Verticillium longisporum]CRK43934.1 hypothetical protein BN1723_005919 [Verticillium longisporum]
MVSFSALFVGAVALAAQSVSASPTKPTGLVPRTFEGQKYGCKCYPGDACWPQQSEWDGLNAKVNGNLHVHVPPEAACYNTFDGLLGSQQTYDAAKCAEVTKSWTSETWTVDQEALNIWKYFTNVTCVPTTDPTKSCTLGFYGVYVIMAKTKDHIKAGIDFARDHNLRLVIRNTGHDFVGRSTGWGSLIINTYSFQDIKFHSKWTGAGTYEGGAVTVGAGVQGVTILKAAQKQNPKLTVVTGECKTVGLAGGYVAGGGHGPLTSAYGMAADNTLEFEVVTAKGEFVVANEKVNADLYFALRGGGPSTYGVVTSVTFRTYPEVQVAGGLLDINATLTNDENLIWEGIRIFHKYGNHLVDNGLYTYFEIFPFTFHARPFVAVGKTKAELDAILKPLLDELTAAGVPFTSMTKGYPTLWELYNELFEDEAAGLHALSGGWGITHQDITNNNDGIVKAFRTVQSPRADLPYTGALIGHFFRPPNSGSTAALNPRWRDSTNFIIATMLVPENASAAQKADLQKVLTNNMDGALREAAPGGYAYINEADPFTPNFSTHFWGDKTYAKLKCVRDKWDPNMVFYAQATVNTEKWAVIEGNTRLCKKL